MSDESKNLPVPVVTQVEPLGPSVQAKAREEAYRRSDRGTQPHVRPGSLTNGGRRV